MTNQYLNDPHAASQGGKPLEDRAQDDGTWCPSDPPPPEMMLPPLQGDSPAHSSSDREETISPFEWARQNHSEPLAVWICENGGYINTSLEIGMSPTLGCRWALVLPLYLDLLLLLLQMVSTRLAVQRGGGEGRVGRSDRD